MLKKKKEEGVSAVCIPELPNSNVAANIELHHLAGV